MRVWNFFVCLTASASALTLPPAVRRSGSVRMDAMPMSTNERIEKMIADNKVRARKPFHRLALGLTLSLLLFAGDALHEG